MALDQTTADRDAAIASKQSLEAALTVTLETRLAELQEAKRQLADQTRVKDLLESELQTAVEERNRALSREEELSLRLDVLSSDPATANVRRYGVTNTRNLQLQMEELFAKLQSAQREVADSTAKCSELSRTCDAANCDLKSEKELSRRAQEEVAALRAQKATVEEELSKTTQQLKKLESDREALQGRLQSAQCTAASDAAAIQALTAQLDELKAKCEATELNAKEVRQQLYHAEEECRIHASNEAGLAVRISIAEKAAATAKSEKELLVDDNMQLVGATKQLKETIQELQQQLALAKSRAGRTASSHVKKRHGIAAAVAKLAKEEDGAPPE